MGDSSNGGGIFAFGNYFYFPPIAIHNTTVAGNHSQAATGGGLYIYYGDLDVSNSIVSGNTGNASPDDIQWMGYYDLTFDVNHSLVQTTAGLSYTGGNNVTGVDPLLGPLADNGGPTQTHALLTGSPAIDAGDPTAMSGGSMTPDFDQRGELFPRVVDGDGDGIARIDMGAFELQSMVQADCDFDADGNCDLDDIDALIGVIAGATHEMPFDLTGDGIVDLADRDAWLAAAGAMNLSSGNPYLVGDSNLDGAVDGQDFLIWNTNKFTPTAKWSLADWNADGTTDGQDFLSWNANKFQVAIPTPGILGSSPVRRTGRESVSSVSATLESSMREGFHHGPLSQGYAPLPNGGGPERSDANGSSEYATVEWTERGSGELADLALLNDLFR